MAKDSKRRGRPSARVGLCMLAVGICKALLFMIVNCAKPFLWQWTSQNELATYLTACESPGCCPEDGLIQKPFLSQTFEASLV